MATPKPTYRSVQTSARNADRRWLAPSQRKLRRTHIGAATSAATCGTTLGTVQSRVRHDGAGKQGGLPGRFAILTMLFCSACSGSKSPTTPTPIFGLSCGEERWAVKTLSDPDASRVNVTQNTPTTISALNALPPHCSNLPQARTFAVEFQSYQMTGRVTLVRLEEDRDYHIAMVDPSAPTETMIVESIDPRCEGAVSSPHLPLLTQARASFDALIGSSPTSLIGQTVRVRGVGFYDADHGQTGRSRSCIELHPILGLERVAP